MKHLCPDCLHACNCGGDAEHCAHDCDRQPITVTVEFIKAWGHPTRNEVYGPPQRARCSKRIAKNLESGGYVKLVVPA